MLQIYLPNDDVCLIYIIATVINTQHKCTSKIHSINTQHKYIFLHNDEVFVIYIIATVINTQHEYTT